MAAVIKTESNVVPINTFCRQQGKPIHVKQAILPFDREFVHVDCPIQKFGIEEDIDSPFFDVYVNGGGLFEAQKVTDQPKVRVALCDSERTFFFSHSEQIAAVLCHGRLPALRLNIFTA